MRQAPVREALRELIATRAVSPGQGWLRAGSGSIPDAWLLGVAATVVVARHPLVVTVIWVAIAIVNVGCARRL